jgi:hypothetical protein
LPFNTCPLIDRFFGAIAREQTDRFRPKAEARGWLTVPVCELTVYEFKDLPNPDYPWADDRHRLDSSY